MNTFSIIIPTCNRPFLLKLCLNKLINATGNINELGVEIIVTDDSYDERVIDTLKIEYPQVIFIQGLRKGPAANRNNGAKLAKGEWLIFLDDDVLPDVNLLKSYSTGINEYPNARSFEGAIHPDNWQLLKLDMAECPVNTTGGCFWSANVCIKKELFISIGGFDEQFIIAAQEDQDIYQRIIPYTEVPFLKNALVIHPVRIVSLTIQIQSTMKRIENWLKFQQKTKSLTSSLFIGYKTQFFAFINNIKNVKPKSATYNIYIMLVLPFAVMMSKIKRNV